MLHGIGDISDGESPASYLYGDRGTTVKVRGTAICDAITGQSRPAVILTLLHLAALHSCKVSHLFHGANTKTSFCTNEKCLICLFFNISAHTCIYSRDSFLKSDVLHTLHFQFSNPFGTKNILSFYSDSSLFRLFPPLYCFLIVPSHVYLVW